MTEWNTASLSKAIQEHHALTYARGALPWPIFLDQVIIASKPKPPPLLSKAAKSAKQKGADSRRKILAYIRKHPWVGTAKISEALGISKTTVGAHCHSLIKEKLITTSQNKTTAFIYAVA